MSNPQTEFYQKPAWSLYIALTKYPQTFALHTLAIKIHT